jgi:branched-chain amino acid transport system ATP-binding protein
MTLLEAHIESGGYGQGNVLRDVNVEIDENEIVVLLGRNGAGKTTLLRALSGVLPRVRGRMVFDGANVANAPTHRRVRAGLVHVPEGRHVFATLTVLENLTVAASAVRQRRATSQTALERAFDLFPILLERQRQPAGSLSGGEQQMLAVARGLMLTPRLLMVDEASLGLAPITVERLYTALKRVGSEFGICVLLVEQNAHASLGIADRGYVMDRGSTILSGPTHEVLEMERVASVYMGRERS